MFSSRLAALVVRLSWHRHSLLRLKLQQPPSQVCKAYPKTPSLGSCSSWRCACFGDILHIILVVVLLDSFLPSVAVSKCMPHFVAKKAARRIIFWRSLVVVAVGSVLAVVVIFQNPMGPGLQSSSISITVGQGLVSPLAGERILRFDFSSFSIFS